MTVINKDFVISLRTFEDEENGNFGVECLVSGLYSQDQADKALDFIQEALCGKEITVQ